MPWKEVNAHYAPQILRQVRKENTSVTTKRKKFGFRETHTFNYKTRLLEDVKGVQVILSVGFR